MHRSQPSGYLVGHPRRSKMKPLFSTLILLVLSAIFLWQYDVLMQTWRPMFILILTSFSIALIIAYFGFRKAEIRSSSRKQSIIYSSLTVFLFIAILNFLWAISEEGLIHYYLATYGQDDTGGRYFYPGNSGMGYAKGLSNPFSLISGILLVSISLAGILGIPFSFILNRKI